MGSLVSMVMGGNQDKDREINTSWVETNEEFPMNYYVMERVGLEELDNFFKGLVPMLRNLRRAHQSKERSLHHDN
jgi:hypothetical protein